MIYLEPALQKKVIPMFHYALKKRGFLFLGASESVGGFGELFGTVSKRNKIFSRKIAPVRAFHLEKHGAVPGSAAARAVGPARHLRGGSDPGRVAPAAPRPSRAGRSNSADTRLARWLIVEGRVHL